MPFGEPQGAGKTSETVGDGAGEATEKVGGPGEATEKVGDGAGEATTEKVGEGANTKERSVNLGCVSY